MKYAVTGVVTISIWTTVEAESEEDAVFEAEGRPMMNFCHYCASSDSSKRWVASELDGTPYDLSVEPAE